jgi:hypothetical protein
MLVADRHVSDADSALALWLHGEGPAPGDFADDPELPVVIDTYTDKHEAEVMRMGYARLLRRHKLTDVYRVEMRHLCGMYVIRVGPLKEPARQADGGHHHRKVRKAG